MRKLLILTILIYILTAHVSAQAIVFTGATAHIGDGSMIENSLLAFQDGKIIYVGKANDGTTFKDAKITDVTGMHIYPGFIAANCYVGLNEIDAARATRDFAEVGSYNPNIRALVAYNTDSKIIPTLRFNGILALQTVPQGGIISGTSSVVNLWADNWEDAAMNGDDGIHLNWHEIYNITDTKQAEQHEDFLKETQEFFAESEAYMKVESPTEKNLKYEAMRGLYNQQKKIYIHVNAARYISEAIQFCQKHGLKPVIVGGNESYIIADFLKKNDISVILMNIHRLPEKTSDPMDLPYKIPSLLKQAGVRFCIGVRGSWEVRNLAFQAGTTAGYGLTKEEALKTITLDAAKILGVDKLYGSLENGKAAQFFISKGDALDMDGNQVVYAFSNGNPVDLKGQQQELFEKYHKKYFKK